MDDDMHVDKWLRNNVQGKSFGEPNMEEGQRLPFETSCLILRIVSIFYVGSIFH